MRVVAAAAGRRDCLWRRARPHARTRRGAGGEGASLCTHLTVLCRHKHANTPRECADDRRASTCVLAGVCKHDDDDDHDDNRRTGTGNRSLAHARVHCCDCSDAPLSAAAPSAGPPCPCRARGARTQHDVPGAVHVQEGPSPAPPQTHTRTHTQDGRMAGGRPQLSSTAVGACMRTGAMLPLVCAPSSESGRGATAATRSARPSVPSRRLSQALQALLGLELRGIGGHGLGLFHGRRPLLRRGCL